MNGYLYFLKWVGIIFVVIPFGLVLLLTLIEKKYPSTINTFYNKIVQKFSKIRGFIKENAFGYIAIALIVGFFIGLHYGATGAQKTIGKQVEECLTNNLMSQPTMIECVYDALILP